MLFLLPSCTTIFVLSILGIASFSGYQIYTGNIALNDFRPVVDAARNYVFPDIQESTLKIDHCYPSTEVRSVVFPYGINNIPMSNSRDPTAFSLKVQRLVVVETNVKLAYTSFTAGKNVILIPFREGVRFSIKDGTLKADWCT